ncbi:unnamed protein product [Caenorhabditis auriculariae]|uniref:Uncharacterized protein n=1 Tax=Caenorhabditis auriculariae TaxID=2777116 RepID=A0A8S1GQP4_9PELO|nr:unnamed protein product [Caenorhabditis auriculariae]
MQWLVASAVVLVALAVGKSEETEPRPVGCTNDACRLAQLGFYFPQELLEPSSADLSNTEQVPRPQMNLVDSDSSQQRQQQAGTFKRKRDYDFVRFGRSSGPSKKASSYDYIRFGRK